MALHFQSTIEAHIANPPSRRYVRTLFSVPITVRHLCPNGVRSTRGISLDIGEGGLGAIFQGDVRVGDTVSIDLRLSEQEFSTVAIVRYTSRVSSGFEFVGLTAEEKSQIASIVGHT
jgi:hypothetical protein